MPPQLSGLQRVAAVEAPAAAAAGSRSAQLSQALRRSNELLRWSVQSLRRLQQAGTYRTLPPTAAQPTSARAVSLARCGADVLVYLCLIKQTIVGFGSIWWLSSIVYYLGNYCDWAYIFHKYERLLYNGESKSFPLDYH